MRVTRESDGNVYLISDAGLEFPVRIIEREHSESWVEEVTTELAQPFDTLNETPIRFAWLWGKDVSEIIFVCPHAMVDALSVAYLARDFLIFLADPQADVDPVPLTPAMSELIPDFPGKRIAIWRAKLKAAMLKLFLGRGPKVDEQPKVDLDSARPEYCLLPWELTPEQTTALVARCRAEGTTVHAALSTAFLRAFGEFHGDGWNRKIQSPISLRERLTRPVGESFGLFVNLAEFSVDCAPERDFWKVAHEIKQGFIQHTGDKPIFSPLIESNVFMDELASVLTPEMMAQSVIGVDYDLSITNLGRLDFPVQYGSLLLEALFGPSLGGNPEDIVLGVITIGDKMHFALTFTGLKLNMSQAEHVKEKAMDWLANATDW